jgi:hypothetical protein
VNFLEVGAISGATLAILGVLRAVYVGASWLRNVNELVQHELTHNEGSSMKDSLLRIEQRLEKLERDE